MENIPSNTHLYFDFILSLVTIDYNRDDNWLSNNFVTYIKLREGADAKALESKFPKMIDTYVGPQVRQALGSDFTMDKFRSSGNIFEYTLMSIADIHLHSNLVSEIGGEQRHILRVFVRLNRRLHPHHCLHQLHESLNREIC